MMGFWPKGYKSCFFLSFDYDASSAETWKTPDDLSSLSKGRYAPRVAIPRILDLLDRYELKTTFFIPGWTCDNHPDSVKEILSREHEIGAHSYAHEKMTDLTAEKEADVWERSMAALEKVGVKPDGYRAPYWMFGDRSINHMKRLGFKYSSNMMDDDMPYMLDHKGKPTGSWNFQSSGCSTTGPTSRWTGAHLSRCTNSGSRSGRRYTKRVYTLGSPVTPSASVNSADSKY